MLSCLNLCIESTDNRIHSTTHICYKPPILRKQNHLETSLKQSLIPHPSNIKHIEVISPQFDGLNLTIYRTIIHYQKIKVCNHSRDTVTYISNCTCLLTVIMSVVTFIIEVLTLTTYVFCYK